MSVRLCSVPECRGGRRGLLKSWSVALAVLAAFWFTCVPNAAAQSSLPGTIQAEDFDNGGSSVGYWDSTPGNAGGQYRSTNVDIEACSEGGYDVGWAVPGEWLNYTVNVASGGAYTASFRVATQNGGSFHLEVNGQNTSGQIFVDPTGGWQSWITVQRPVTLAGGSQVMRIVFDSGNVNVNWFNISAGSGFGSGSATSFTGASQAIPGWIQAEDFDNGLQGDAYSDTTPGNSGGAYRSTDVDIERTNSGGYAVAYIAAGEWLRYTVNVAATGTYTVTARVASAGSGGTFYIASDDGGYTGSMRIPNTGGWQNYQDLAATMSLSAGTHAIWVIFDSNGSTGAVGNLSAMLFEYGSSTAAPSPAPTSPSPSSGGGNLRVMTWNINFGHGDPWGQAQLIASVGADVATLQEASTYDEDMPSTYASRLQQLTGQTWYSSWGPSLTSGGSQGTLILSRYPMVDKASTVLYGTGTAYAAVNVGGVVVPIFAAHLDYYDTSKRTQQMYALLDWARGVSGPRIIGGDFNSWWGEWWISQMENEYSDTWQTVTGSVENGYTVNGSVRFDYLFRSYTGQDRATPTNIWVQSTGLSDHWPVIADYNIR
jgi:endonuclease/exonuclease/phosphatase family metal-dependent hydrolase